MERLRPKKITVSSKEVEELREKAMQSLRDDFLVYPVISEELRLTKREVATSLAALIDLQEDMHYCASCPGFEACEKATPHFCLKLVREEKLIVRKYTPCPKMLSLASFQERFIRCSFPPDWRDEDFKSIEKSVSARNLAVAAMVKLSKGEDRWVYLIGNSGSGKSFMLACLANRMTREKGPGAFVDSATILNELKEKSINDKIGFEDLLGRLQRASILVFDDFGNEFKTEYVFTNLLFPLLSYRDKAGLPTCFASDFKIAQIADMWQPKIGPERAAQLKKILLAHCGKEYDVSGVAIH